MEKSHLTGTLAVKWDLDCHSEGDKWPDAKGELWFYLGSVGPESSLMWCMNQGVSYIKHRSFRINIRAYSSEICHHVIRSSSRVHFWNATFFSVHAPSRPDYSETYYRISFLCWLYIFLGSIKSPDYRKPRTSSYETVLHKIINPWSQKAACCQLERAGEKRSLYTSF